MGIPTVIALYLIIWWVVLFGVLPLGVKTFEEMGLERPPGCDSGAPANPNLKRKFITTTWVSAVVVLVIVVVVHMHLIPMPSQPPA